MEYKLLAMIGASSRVTVFTFAQKNKIAALKGKTQKQLKFDKT